MSGIINRVGAKSGVIGRSSDEPAFSASSGSLTGCNHAVYTLITFSTEAYDEGGCYNNTGGTVTLNGISTPLYAFAPNVAGKYNITARVFLPDLNADANYVLSIYKNGSATANIWSTQGATQNICFPVLADLEANGTSDYFQIYVYHNHEAGSTLNTATGTTYSQFSAFRITD